MLTPLALLLALAPAGAVLSPEAAEHNARAMIHYDAGELAPAVDGFYAAYQAMPDARRDLFARERLVGSMRSTLLDLYEQAGDAAPLCRLQSILREHAEGLLAAFPNEPDRLETRSVRARHEEVTRQLTAFGPDACGPPPPLLPVVHPAATPGEPPAPAAAPDVTAPDRPVHRRRVRAGLGTLIPGLMLFAPMAGLLVHRAAGERELTALREETRGRTPTPQQDAEAAALGRRYTSATTGAAVFGATGAALVVTGAVLLATGARARRLALAPWGGWGRGGLIIQGRF